MLSLLAAKLSPAIFYTSGAIPTSCWHIHRHSSPPQESPPVQVAAKISNCGLADRAARVEHPLRLFFLVKLLSLLPHPTDLTKSPPSPSTCTTIVPHRPGPEACRDPTSSRTRTVGYYCRTTCSRPPTCTILPSGSSKLRCSYLHDTAVRELETPVFHAALIRFPTHFGIVQYRLTQLLLHRAHDGGAGDLIQPGDASRVEEDKLIRTRWTLFSGSRWFNAGEFVFRDFTTT